MLMLPCSASTDQRHRDGQVIGGESDDGPPTVTLQVEVAVATRQLTAQIITIPSVFIQEMKTAHKPATGWDLRHAQGVDGVFMIAESLRLQWELEFNFVLKVNARLCLCYCYCLFLLLSVAAAVVVVVVVVAVCIRVCVCDAPSITLVRLQIVKPCSRAWERLSCTCCLYIGHRQCPGSRGCWTALVT
jgi:hypothetical protein